MTLYVLKRRACSIGRQLVVAGNNPDLAFVLDTYLRRPEDMSGRMKRDANAVDLRHRAVRLSFDLRLRVESNAGDRLTFFCYKIILRTAVGVIGMSVGDNSPIHGKPGINIKIALLTVQAAFGERDELAPCHEFILSHLC